MLGRLVVDGGGGGRVRGCPGSLRDQNRTHGITGSIGCILGAGQVRPLVCLSTKEMMVQTTVYTMIEVTTI